VPVRAECGFLIMAGANVGSALSVSRRTGVSNQSLSSTSIG